MSYNNFFEIGSIIILLIVLLDYSRKIKIFRTESRLFISVIYLSLIESGINFLSTVLIANTERVPVSINVGVCTLFFAVQATKLFLFSCYVGCYVDPSFSIRSRFFFILFSLFIVNFALSITSPLTGFYFYFDNFGRYIQGYGSDLSYFFYPISVLMSLLFIIYNRKHLMWKQIRVAIWVSAFICFGVFFQFNNRSILMMGFGVAISVLYIYMTLENPNDFQDKLTLSANSYAFKELIDNMVGSGKPFDVIFVDLCKFRYFNSIYGNDNGDYILKSVARYLEDTFDGSIVFRLQNDDFAVCCGAEANDVNGKIDILNNRFFDTWTLLDGRDVEISAMIAVCSYPENFVDHTELIKLQSMMLGLLKQKSHGSVLRASAKITEKYRRDELIEHILCDSINDNKLLVYYQPIVDSKTNTVVSLEALSRLSDKKLGNIPPDEFIAVAEKTGLIIPLGFYVIEKACEFISECIIPDEKTTITNVHINFSAIQCAYSDIDKKIIELIDSYKVPHSMISFELTENTILDSPEIIRMTMESLISKGITFSLDDYGTGYSNISYLAKFPFDRIKFDKHMTWSFFTSIEANLIMRKEFELLKEMDKIVILEGIETKEQYLEMVDNGIEYFQGYYFSKAVPKEEIISFANSIKAQ